MTELTPVTMKLRQSTIDKIGFLRDLGKLVNNADSVRWAVEIALIVAQAIARGDKVTIEGKFNTDELSLPQMEETP